MVLMKVIINGVSSDEAEDDGAKLWDEPEDDLFGGNLGCADGDDGLI